MDYTAACFGKNEIGLDLVAILGEFALNEHKPRVVAANLKDRASFWQDMVAGSAVSTGPGPKVGFIGIIDGKMIDLQDSNVKLENNVKLAVENGIKEFKTKPDLLVLLFQGKLDAAKVIAQSKLLPKFDVIVIPIEEEDPSSQPVAVVGKTMIVSAGQKGRHVTVVGAFRTTAADHPFELRYQLVEIGPQFETPKGLDATNPIHALSARLCPARQE